MNELSWLIYLADLAANVKFMGGAVLFCSVAASVVLAIVGALNAADAWGGDEKGQLARALARQDAWKKLWPAAVIGAAVVTFVPSSSTLYAIAASEVGERVIGSETGGKAVQALNAWLDRQIAGTPEAAQ